MSFKTLLHLLLLLLVTVVPSAFSSCSIFPLPWKSTEESFGDWNVKIALAALDLHNEKYFKVTPNLKLGKVESGKYRRCCYLQNNPNYCDVQYQLDITVKNKDELYRVVALLPMNAYPSNSSVQLISLIQIKTAMEIYPDRIPGEIERGFLMMHDVATLLTVISILGIIFTLLVRFAQ